LACGAGRGAAAAAAAAGSAAMESSTVAECMEVGVQSLGSSLIEGLRVVQGLRVVRVFLYRYSMKN